MKIGRTKLDIATVNVAVSVRLEEGVINESRVALGAVAPVPLRLHAAEESLRGKRPNEEIFREVAKICCANITPIDDLRASAEYRMAATEALVQDALAMACMRAGDD
jgi:carbon-monoxide dehydrogenase medium subunit